MTGKYMQAPEGKTSLPAAARHIIWYAATKPRRGVKRQLCIYNKEKKKKPEADIPKCHIANLLCW